MSADPYKDTAIADNPETQGLTDTNSKCEVNSQTVSKKCRSVSFPDDNQLVTKYFEPANPWQDVPSTTRAQIAADYLDSCRRHNTPPIEAVLHQIRELPENAIGGGNRASRLTLSDCSLAGSAPADALEALLSKVQFRRIEMDHVEIDDEGAEAMFDMIEYYESATIICISGPRQFGIRGWQAASRMIKKSSEISELEVRWMALAPAHAPVLARALRPAACRLRSLSLPRVDLSGEPLLCLVIALKSNASIRELRLPDNNLTVSDAQQIASLLRFNTTIQLLDLSNNQIQDAGVGHIADALVEQASHTPPSATNSPQSPLHCPLSSYESRGLAFLVLWNNQLTRNCAPHLSKALRSSHSLCVLNVGRNSVGAESLRAFTSGSALLSLGLQCARLAADSAPHLIHLLKAETGLQRLDLRDNRLGVAGLQAILTGLKENKTITQIDLDDPPDTTNLSEDTEAMTVAVLTREIRALCRNNEPPASNASRRVARKISLTCHTQATQIVSKNSPMSECRRSSRLRSPAPSPAPSPAGSPVPHHTHHSRFSVTRVTPERESSTDSTSSSPSTPTRPSTPSRFRVVQVAEPPQIQVHPAQKRGSRFSVTRNYDAMYNPSPSPSPSPSPTPSVTLDTSVTTLGLDSPSVSPIQRTESATTLSSALTLEPSPTDSRVPSLSSLSNNMISTSDITISDVKVSKSDSSVIITPRLVPNSRFSISPTPINLEMRFREDSPSKINATNEDTERSVNIIDLEPNIIKSVVKSMNVTEDFTTIDKHKDLVQPIDKDLEITAPVLTKSTDRQIDFVSLIDKCTDLVCPVVKNIEEKPTLLKDITIDKQTEVDPIEETRLVAAKETDISTQTKHKEALESILWVENELERKTQPKVIEEPNIVKLPKIDDVSYETVTTVAKMADNVRNNELTVKNDDIMVKNDEVIIKNENVTVQNDEASVRNEKVVKDDVIILKSDDKVKNDSTLAENFNTSRVLPPIIDNTVTKIGIETDRSDVSNKNEDSMNDDEAANPDTEISEPVKSVSDSAKNAGKSYSDAVKTDPKHYKDKTENVIFEKEIVDDAIKTETILTQNSVEISDSDKIDVSVQVTVKTESLKTAKVHSDKDIVNIDELNFKKEDTAMKQIEEITQDLGILIREMKDLSCKNKKVKSDDKKLNVVVDTDSVPGNYNRDVVLKKNKSESSLDSPDLEVSRLMNKKLVGSPFCDSSSSLEISGSSIESLNAIENHPKPIIVKEMAKDVKLDRRKVELSTESSVESTSEMTPVNSGNFLNMSVSSNESVSPIIFSKTKKIHDSLSSLEASMSSLDSGKQEKVMVTSADSGIEYSLQNPTENKEDNSSNEGTLTHYSSLKESVKKSEIQETLTSSPKRTSSLLDVPALKTKGLDRMRKISWVAPSSSFHIPKVEMEKEKPSHLEKLLSLFQHPTSLFSRTSQDEEKKSASNTPPRKDSSLTSSFWSWGSTIEKDKDEDSSEATDTTLSERVQVSYVDESFSKKLDSKTPSTDTDNTLSEFQSFPIQTNAEASIEVVTDNTTDENLVQTSLDLSLMNAGSNGNKNVPVTRASDMTDLNKPNDMNKNYDAPAGDSNKNPCTPENVEKCENVTKIDKEEAKEDVRLEPVRPRSFAAVLKSSGSENSLDKQPSPDAGQLVDKLPSKVIRGIKENISPENTLTSSMTNTQALAIELTERQVKSQAIAVWEPLLDKNDPKLDENKTYSELAPIATIEETCDEAADNTIELGYIDDIKLIDERNISTDSGVTSLDIESKPIETVIKSLENVDLGKEALAYLIYEGQDFEPETEQAVVPKVEEGSLAQELKEAEIKEMLDLSPELVIDEAVEVPEVLTANEIKGLKSTPAIPERAKLKKSNSLEDLSQRLKLLRETESVETKSSPKAKTIAFKVPETSPRDIPERRTKLRTRSGSSPKSLPESLNKPCSFTKIEPILGKKKKKVSSLGKMARDSLLALNMSEDEIAEFRRSYKLTSVESLRSLESVSEDANSQSGTSIDSRCRSCLRTSQESLMSLDSITEDCKCGDDEKPGRSAR